MKKNTKHLIYIYKWKTYKFWFMQNAYLYIKIWLNYSKTSRNDKKTPAVKIKTVTKFFEGANIQSNISSQEYVVLSLT